MTPQPEELRDDTPRPYQKKPVTVMAMLYDGTEASAAAIMEWTEGSTTPALLTMLEETSDDGETTTEYQALLVSTLEGTMEAKSGSYIVRGLHGEHYPVRAAIFEATYLPVVGNVAPTFSIGQRVRKIKGSSWTGRIVGFYRTSLTPEGYAVESENEPGSVQIYPAAALEDADPKAMN